MQGAHIVMDLTLWHKTFLSIGGLWPTDKRDLRFYIFFAYFFIHTFMVIFDFVMVVGDFGNMINNLREMAVLFITLGKMVPLRFSTALSEMMLEHNVKGNSHYKNDEERRIYLSYIGDGLKICKLTLWANGLLNVVHYLKALQVFIASEVSGGAPVFMLPYHTRRLFNLTEVHTYFLVYAYSAPMVYGFFCDSLIGSVIASYIYDMCGQLSVLSYRIRNAKVAHATMDINSLELIFRDVIRKHTNIIKNNKIINAAFNLPLFFELIACTLIQGIVMYNILLNFNSLTNIVVLISYVLYISGALILMFTYCIAGSVILQESINFHYSWYECDWFDMPPQCKTSIIICMIRAGIPLNLNGAGFYIYSMESFAGIVKSSVAYVSMLRQLV